jgi:hypothetical protein
VSACTRHRCRLAQRDTVRREAPKPRSAEKNSANTLCTRSLGPVTNAPLAMADYRHLPPSSLAKHGHLFGVGFDIHHDASQHWAYIQHQMPDDSDQGKHGEALYCGHVAVQVDGDAEGIDPGLIRPRESIEVRLVAIWE